MPREIECLNCSFCLYYKNQSLWDFCPIPNKYWAKFEPTWAEKIATGLICKWQNIDQISFSSGHTESTSLSISIIRWRKLKKMQARLTFLQRLETDDCCCRYCCKIGRKVNLFICNQCGQMWRNFTTLAKFKSLRHFLRSYLVFGKMLNLLWEICYAFG